VSVHPTREDEGEEDSLLSAIAIARVAICAIALIVVFIVGHQIEQTSFVHDSPGYRPPVY
jgi:hypothetical protein